MPIVDAVPVRCEGCGVVCSASELNFCLECGESYCARMSRDCYCSCSRVKRAAHDAVHGAGSYDRQAEEFCANVSLEEFGGVLARASLLLN